jgi:hypothetical protein
MECGEEITYGNVTIVDSAGHELGMDNQAPVSSDWVVAMLEKAPITSSVLFRRKVIDSCKWDSSLPCGQEYGLLVNCAIRGFTFRFTPTAVAAIRQHPSPTRISNNRHRFYPQVQIDLQLQFQRDLEQVGRYDMSRKASIHYSLINEALFLWRTGRRNQAKSVFSSIDRKLLLRSPRYKNFTSAGLAAAGGLQIGHAAWCCGGHLRRIGKGLTMRLQSLRRP